MHFALAAGVDWRAARTQPLEKVARLGAGPNLRIGIDVEIPDEVSFRHLAARIHVAVLANFYPLEGLHAEEPLDSVVNLLRRGWRGCRRVQFGEVLRQPHRDPELPRTAQDLGEDRHNLAARCSVQMVVSTA